MASSFYSMLNQLLETFVPPTNTATSVPRLDVEHDNIDNDDIEDNDIDNNDDDPSDILSTNFNQDNCCISVATMNGFRIFQCKPFTKAFEVNNNNISCRSVCMLFATSLVALIGNKSLRNVKLYNTKNKQELCRLNFKSTVLSIKMNRCRLAVCVIDKIHIFDLINNMKQIYEVNTYQNGMGIFDLCCDDDNNLLAYPDKSGCGHIGILDSYNLQKRTIIEAHDSSLQIISFNADGNYLCSASMMGTLIRIFAIPSGTHIYTFRRGTYPSSIYSISFNPSSTLLAITSQKNISLQSIITNTTTSSLPPTIHIFDLNKYKYNESKKISSSQSINQLNNKINEYLPQTVKNQIEHPRSIITINIKNKNKKNKNEKNIVKCGWLNDYSLVCATKNGYFYRYHINDNDNKYKLLSEHTLKDNDIDLHKQQKTKIYKNDDENNNNDDDDDEIKNDEINEENIEKKEIKKSADNNNNNNNKNNKNNKNKSNLIIDDLFDLSDAEFETTTPGNLP